MRIDRNSSAGALLLALAALSCAGPRRAEPAPAGTSETELRPSYGRAVELPAGCDQPLELERVVCAVERAIARPELPPSQRACAERHMKPIRQHMQGYLQSHAELEQVRAQRSLPLAMGATPPGLAPSPLRREDTPVDEAKSKQADREQRAEIQRQEREVLLRKRNLRAQAKLADLFRYVEPCIDASVPFERPPGEPPTTDGTPPGDSGAAELL